MQFQTQTAEKNQEIQCQSPKKEQNFIEEIKNSSLNEEVKPLNSDKVLQQQQQQQQEEQSTTNDMNNNSNNLKQFEEGRWSKEEHQRFLDAIELYNKNWKKVEEHVGTRNGAQIRSHAQKFFNKIKKEVKKKNQGLAQLGMEENISDISQMSLIQQIKYAQDQQSGQVKSCRNKVLRENKQLQNKGKNICTQKSNVAEKNNNFNLQQQQDESQQSGENSSSSGIISNNSNFQQQQQFMQRNSLENSLLKDITASNKNQTQNQNLSQSLNFDNNLSQQQKNQFYNIQQQQQQQWLRKNAIYMQNFQNSLSIGGYSNFLYMAVLMNQFQNKLKSQNFQQQQESQQQQKYLVKQIQKQENLQQQLQQKENVLSFLNSKGEISSENGQNNESQLKIEFSEDIEDIISEDENQSQNSNQNSSQNLEQDEMSEIESLMELKVQKLGSFTIRQSADQKAQYKKILNFKRKFSSFEDICSKNSLNQNKIKGNQNQNEKQGDEIEKIQKQTRVV
ncbi:Homeodomain protein [Pseudocohnilembus persalinus]|uniref:Homeodomain protein n=1 Tax=Pseudocohnilembus persalinus TaxID=266149 RepID=A0A0V0R7L9_PSEPJ|nr:Homeodomain protein [Pseudocohnilembus persalinus]|eukprot:KRX10483.1 Homeodomain protein [Pseudocohnilembus persalinus]